MPSWCCGSIIDLCQCCSSTWSIIVNTPTWCPQWSSLAAPATNSPRLIMREIYSWRRPPLLHTFELNFIELLWANVEVLCCRRITSSLHTTVSTASLHRLRTPTTCHRAKKTSNNVKKKLEQNPPKITRLLGAPKKLANSAKWRDRGVFWRARSSKSRCPGCGGGILHAQARQKSLRPSIESRGADALSAHYISLSSHPLSYSQSRIKLKKGTQSSVGPK